MSDFVENALLPVLPVERPLGAVSVHLSGGVAVAEHVVAHDGEQGGRLGAVELAELHPRPRRRRTGSDWNG